MTNLAKRVDELTDQNDHTGAAIVMAEGMGNDLGEAIKTVLLEIEAEHELNGDMRRERQMLRDELARMARENLIVRGLL